LAPLSLEKFDLDNRHGVTLHAESIGVTWPRRMRVFEQGFAGETRVEFGVHCPASV
jgi:hypothetical protein